ncbi:MAG: prepilin-type N-terminal cleavage/methylation domain-containing protein [Betaproteobacteria bacterium]|nr:prepilin-type N-terminal cleavage/methylation domain-containing protein [Betaproteobacteria bacterium]
MTGNWKLETGNSKLETSERGFTLLELALAIALIGVLATVLLQRLGYYQELAEKAAMDATVRLIKTGLQIRLAELIITNRQAEAPALEREDPVQWLERKPPNYGGIYHDYAQSGTWYYDERERQLVYVVNSGGRLEFGAKTDLKEIRFQARLLKDRLQLAGGPVESVTGITFSAVTPYRWP